MTRITRITSFIRTLTGRMVLGELLIHSILIPALFLGINIVVKDGYESRFIEQAHSKSALLAVLISHDINQQEIDSLLNAAISSNQILAATLVYEMGNAIHGQSNTTTLIPFKEDQQFAQHDDNTYHISTPLITNQGTTATLQTSFDEKPIAEQIQNTYQVSIVLAFAYILITLILSGLLGQQLTRPIRKLRDDARAIASGNTDKQLNVISSISEVASLTDNLETMKKALIKHSQDSLAREAHLRSVMDNVVDGIIITNTEGMIESLNPAAISLFDYTKGELIKEHINILLDVNALLEIEQHGINANNIVSATQSKLQETEGYRKSGAIFPLEVAISKMIVNDQTHYIYVTHDITARKNAENELKQLHDELERRVIIRTSELAAANEELEHQALHDSLTDLPNRVLLLDRLNQSILTNQRNETKLALFMIDLDRFKEINDTLGHHYGDIILQQVAMRMREALHQSCTVARLGGDEFAILLPAIEGRKEPANIATAIIHAIDQPFLLEEQPFHVGASIGIALFPEHGTDTSTLMRHADIAMYVAKKNNGDYTFYDSSLDQHSRDRLALTTELRHAIDNNELRLHYQPKIDFKTGNVAEVEALVRWQHPRFGLMTPDHFIALSEHTGLIRPLTRWVIREALSTCHQWHKMGHILKVAVNLSTHNLHDSQLTEHIQQACNECGIDTGYLVLEITESAVMSDPVSAMKVLGELSDMGINLSIDDFGTGYSSLAYLKQLPMDEIKIDKSFVIDMINDRDDYIIVRSTIDLAHNMGRKVIAEGVESPEIWDALDKMGCDMAQGNYISMPKSTDDFSQWLQDSEWCLKQAN
ncbi:MAG: EAL domain-containing protein [Gammaproteobacteria bacterium]|nr:EAL domain-containing protein [Gammaproteobacteria bacterium]